MSNHSSLVGGSSAERFINCIGAAALGRSVPGSGTSPAALRGSALHYVMEELLKPDATIQPRDLIGDVVELDEKDAEGNAVKVELTEDLVLMTIKPAFDWFEQVLKPDEYWLEEKVEFKGAIAGAFGTADVLYIKGDTAGVVDWKFGENIMVSAEDNSQLRFYLAAAMQSEWFYDLTMGEGIRTLDAYIVQPAREYRTRKAEEAMSNIASHARYSYEELCHFHADLIFAKKLKDRGDRTLTCGKWCQFCPAKPVCPAWSQRGSEAIASLKKVPVESSIFKSGPKKGQVKVVTPAVQSKATLAIEADDTIRKHYMEAVALTGWCEAIKKYVTERFSSGAPISGLKRVIHRESRSWIDEDQARNWARRRGLKSVDYNTKLKLISVSQMENLLGKGVIKEALVKKTPGGTTIVSDNDPRPSVDDVTSSASTNLSNILTKES